MLGQNDAALDALSESLRSQTERSYQVLAEHCYYAAIVGFGEMAELTCKEAISRQASDIGDYDSLGLAHLKMKAWSKAIDDYNKALYGRPDLTVSLYGRGIAKRASGDLAGGEADIAAAKQGEPDIVNIMAQIGVKPL
jgi:tetratricopeptide (TPR) repeat protein